MSLGKGLPATTRKAMLSEEMGDGDGEIVENPIPDEPTPAPLAPPILAAPAIAAPPDMSALITALITGITQANAGTADAIRDALGNAAAMARDPIPEIKVDVGISVYSHPLGTAHNTKLRCPMYLGIYNDDGITTPAFEIYEQTCTEAERVMLNAIQPGVYPGIERNDGVAATWRVVQKTDDNGHPTRLVIAVPATWLAQDQFQQMPGQPTFLRQLLAARETAAA